MASPRDHPEMAGARSRRRPRQPARRVRSLRFDLTDEEYGEVNTAAAQAGAGEGRICGPGDVSRGPGQDEPG
jgi:hypothetical protein